MAENKNKESVAGSSSVLPSTRSLPTQEIPLKCKCYPAFFKSKNHPNKTHPTKQTPLKNSFGPLSSVSSSNPPFQPSPFTPLKNLLGRPSKGIDPLLLSPLLFQQKSQPSLSKNLKYPPLLKELQKNLLLP
ncbi:hypothetical protein YC2023_011212 [Brassica napus]